MAGATNYKSWLPPQRDVMIVEVGPRDGLQNEAFIDSDECEDRVR